MLLGSLIKQCASVSGHFILSFCNFHGLDNEYQTKFPLFSCQCWNKPHVGYRMQWAFEICCLIIEVSFARVHLNCFVQINLFLQALNYTLSSWFALRWFQVCFLDRPCSVTTIESLVRALLERVVVMIRGLRRMEGLVFGAQCVRLFYGPPPWLFHQLRHTYTITICQP